MFTFMFYCVDDGDDGIVLPPVNSILYQALVIVYNKLYTLGNTNLLYYLINGRELTRHFNHVKIPEIINLHADFLDDMEKARKAMHPRPDVYDQPDKESDQPFKQSDIPKPFEPPSKPLFGGKKYKQKSKRKSKRKSRR